MAVIRISLSSNCAGKNGEKPIYASFYLNKEKIVIPCKIAALPECFDHKIGKITTGDRRHKDKNLIIDNIKARINNVMVKYRLRDKQLTKDVFMREFNKPSDFKSFYEYFNYYQKTHPNSIEFSTIDVHTDVINKLKVYKKDLYFDEITDTFLKEYTVYLKKQLNNKESTIMKNLAVIKKYVRAAIKEGYMSENPFDEIKISRNTNNSFEFLTEDELSTLIGVYKKCELTPSYQRVLQFFLFMCFTSLHVGDAKNLLIEQVGAKNFTYYRIKNRNSKPTPIVIPLSSPAKAIIKKVAKGRARGKLFEKLIPDQKINEYIKKIAKDNGINKKLSCKAGRHTFATIFLQKTKDLATLKEILGHTDYRETLIYAHVLEESKQQGVKIFNEFKI